MSDHNPLLDDPFEGVDLPPPAAEPSLDDLLADVPATVLPALDAEAVNEEAPVAEQVAEASAASTPPAEEPASAPSTSVWSDTPGTSKTGSWTMGINNIRPVRDVFAEFSALEGELTDEDARATLAEFLYHNPRFLMDLIGGIKMFPMQEVIMKAMAANDYNLIVAGRGIGKSFIIAMFALYWAIFNPNVRIVIASFSFRQSRAILAMCVKMINDEGAGLLRGCFPNEMRRGTDEWSLEVPNGAIIRCLPLGDGKKIRGCRADVLAIDELAFLPESVIGEILRPFLASKNKIKEQRAINEREDALIAEGKMTEEERTILDDRKKVILSSSASWQFEHLYKKYKDWTDLLSLNPATNPEKYEQFKASGRGYFIARLGWESAPAGLLDLDEILAAKGESSEAMFNREYGAIFTSDSDGFFRASKMQACSIPDGESPCLELIGDPNAEYVLGIDQNSSGSEGSDHFAMCVKKIVTRTTDGRKIGMVVHNYAVAGCGFGDHAIYLLYLLTHFNIVYIGVDSSQGSELEFLNFCNQLETFKQRGLTLKPIHDVDFNRTDFSEMLPEIKRGYNRQERQIVQRQRFSSEWQRPANEYLQASFDHRNIRFAAKIAANDNAATSAMSVDISELAAHEHFKDMTVSEFMSNQDFLIDLVRKECAMIQVKTTDLGTMSFGLPQNLKRTTGASKVRKDSYSALLIANWCVKIYTEMSAVQVQTGPSAFPYALVG